MSGHSITAGRTLRWSAALAALAVVASVSCTEEIIEFRDRELFNPPADSINGFLGYFDVSDKLTSCGNCHIGTQSEWVASGHADAYATLEQSGHAQGFCYGCHTVSEEGHPLDVPAGWNVVEDSAYHDVQCESCHGPGLTHVQNPDASQPLASMNVTVDPDATRCAECHSGAHHPFADEWAQSPHGGVVTFAAGRAECASCHRGQDVLIAWGVNADYLEKDDAEPLAITCAVCHDPHGSPNSAQLRFPIDVPSQEQNLCIKCHHKRAEPEIDASTLRGPHSPEGPLLLGEGAGWFPPGFQPDIDTILGSHGSSANPRLCATCHVSRFEVTDAETGDFVFSATGHLFLAIPCVDASGVPTTDQSCGVAQRSFQACVECHNTENVARSAYITARDRIARLVAEVDSLIALAPAGERDGTDGVFTVADGAWFNARLGELPGTSTHNPFLAENLLEASRSALIAEYNLSPPPPSTQAHRPAPR